MEITTQIAGVTFGKERQAKLKELAETQGKPLPYGSGVLTLAYPITLVREPNNPHDRNAVAIHADSTCIGYVPMDKNAELAQLLDAKHVIGARLIRIKGGGDISYGGDVYISCKTAPMKPETPIF